MNRIRSGPSSVSSRRIVRISLLFAMLASIWLAFTATASAQEGAPAVVDPVSCGHFQTQADAQEVLVSGDLDATGIASLDPDGNGIACEHAFGALDPDSPPPARDYVSCGHFETQAGAQELLHSGTLDENGRASLDGDGNGIACERAFGTGAAQGGPATGTVSTLPRTGSGPEAGSVSIHALVSAAVALAGAGTLRERTRGTH